MSVLAIGLSHRTAPVALLERVSVTGDALVKLLHDVQQDPCVAEAMVVSTCNRVEVYVTVDRFHAAVTAISDLLGVHTGVPVEELTPHFYVHYEERAVEHLFSVVCGLDSMVVGEGQILGQVRQALKLAQRQGTVGATLNELVQQALRVGKRAQTDTGIDKHGASSSPRAWRWRASWPAGAPW
ncbi:glutamyl-tRNA reductase [Nonomuraea thailandensis]